MIIYPAIDLINGNCVRLYKGRFENAKVYEVKPEDVARSYAAEGAKWLHLVDLDGARNPEKRQTKLINDIIRTSGLKVQCGGGIRSAEDVEELLNAGVERVVIGSLAVRSPDIIKSLFKKYGAEKICLAIDVFPDEKGKFRVAVSGWQEKSKAELGEIIRLYQEDGLSHVLCTDISKDGTLTGSNISLYDMMRYEYPWLNVQASGGIKDLNDLRYLKEVGVSGAIIGKALYEGEFTVAQALEIQ